MEGYFTSSSPASPAPATGHGSAGHGSAPSAPSPGPAPAAPVFLLTVFEELESFPAESQGEPWWYLGTWNMVPWNHPQLKESVLADLDVLEGLSFKDTPRLGLRHPFRSG